MAYKSVNRAYNRLYENYTTTATNAPKGMEDIWESNYQAGGGFGYICVSKNPATTTDHNPQTTVECKHVFVSPNLIPSTGITKTHTSGTGTTAVTDTFYVIDNGTNYIAADAVRRTPAQTWDQFTKDKTTCGPEPSRKIYKTDSINAATVVPIASKDTDCFDDVCGPEPTGKIYKGGRDDESVLPPGAERDSHCFVDDPST